MKVLNAIIERNEDTFFAYIQEIDGCVAGGNSYEIVKTNLELMIEEFIKDDKEIKKLLSNGYKLKFQVNLESLFNLIPEINISKLADKGNMNPGLLRQYVAGTKKASEKQTGKVLKAIKELSLKLNSITLTT